MKFSEFIERFGESDDTDCKSVVAILGEPGTGKSAVRAGRYIPQILANGAKIHISNFPLILDGPDGMLAAIMKRCKCTEAEARAKLHVIPDEEYAEWKKCDVDDVGRGGQTQGPWSYFDRIGLDLSECHIAIDECQEVFPPSGTPQAHIKRWREWLSLVRHKGATFEMISQHAVNIHPSILKIAGTHRQFTQTEDERWFWPLLPTRVKDIRQLYSKWTGKAVKIFWEVELGQKEGKFQKVSKRSHRLTPELFTRYDSTRNRDGRSGTERKQEWQRFSWPELLLWLFFRHPAWYSAYLLAPLVVFLLTIPSVRGFAFAWTIGWFVSGTPLEAIAAAPSPSVRDGGASEGEGPAVAPKVVDREVMEVKKLTSKEEEPRPEPVIVVPLRDVLWLLEPGGAFFEQTGFVYEGEEFSEGPHNGERLETVDFQRGRVVLSDGTVYRLHTPRSDKTGGGGFPKDLPASSSGGAAADQAGPRADAANNAQLPSDAGNGARKAPSKAPRYNLRFGGVTRKPIGDAGSSRPSAGSGNGANSSAFEYGAFDSGESVLPGSSTPGGSSGGSPPSLPNERRGD